MVLKALTRAIRQRKEVKGLQVGKKSNIRDPKRFTKKLEITCNFSNVARYRINSEQINNFLCTDNELEEKDIVDIHNNP